MVGGGVEDPLEDESLPDEESLPDDELGSPDFEDVSPEGLESLEESVCLVVSVVFGSASFDEPSFAGCLEDWVSEVSGCTITWGSDCSLAAMSAGSGAPLLTACATSFATPSGRLDIVTDISTPPTFSVTTGPGPDSPEPGRIEGPFPPGQTADAA